MKTFSHIKTVSGLKFVVHQMFIKHFIYFVESKFNKNDYFEWGMSNKKICTCIKWNIELIRKLVNFKEKKNNKKPCLLNIKTRHISKNPTSCCYCFGGHTNIFLFLLPASTFIGYRYQNAETTNMSNKTRRKWRRSQTVRVSKFSLSSP